VAGHPGELVAAAGLAELSREVGGVAPAAAAVREQRAIAAGGFATAFEHALSVKIT
jgi:hypothetical protein